MYGRTMNTIMPTEQIEKHVHKLFDINKGGIASVFAAFVSTLLVLINLPDASLGRLKEIWYIPAFVSTIALLAIVFSGYIKEQRARTEVEVKMLDKLEQVIQNIERLFESNLDNKIYFDHRFDAFDDRLKSIYAGMEKRGAYKPGNDTEKFLQQ